MKNEKGKLISRIAGIVLSGMISMLPTGRTALNDDINVNCMHIVAVAEDLESTNTSENKCCEGNAKNTEIQENEARVKNERIAPKKKKRSQQFYRTKTGKCYHRRNCYCLRNSKIKVNQEEIENADLKPCRKCFK